MKKIILLIITGFSLIAYGQGFVKNSTIEYLSLPTPPAISANFKKADKVKFIINEALTVDSVYIYGGGVLQSIVTKNSDLTATPSGSLGLNFQTKRIVFNLFYSYNTRSIFEIDSLNKFGSALLQPNVQGQSISIKGYGILTERLGVCYAASVSDDLWKINDSITVDASPLMCSIGLRIAPFSFRKIKSADLDFYIDASFTHRSILGDFRNKPYELGQQILNQGGYNGVEFSANFKVDNLELFTKLLINPEDKYLIPSFTGSQVIFGVNLTGKVLTLK